MSSLPVDVRNLLHVLEDFHDWYGLGIEFKVPIDELKAIEKQFRGDLRDCKVEVFDRWLSRARNPTWKDVITALRHMKLIAHADKVEERCYTVSTEVSGESDVAVVPFVPEVTPARANEIEELVDALEAMFLDLVFSLQESLDKKASESPGAISRYRMSVFHIPMSRKKPHIKFLKDKRQEIRNAKDVEDLFSVLATHWNFLNTPFLELLVKKFAHELQQELDDYLGPLDRFCQNTKLYEYKSVFPSTTIAATPPGFSTVAFKLQGDWITYTLKQALELGWQVNSECCLENYTLLFIDSGYGCVRLVWALPPHAIPLMVEGLTPEFLNTCHIDAVHIDGVGLDRVQDQLHSSVEYSPVFEDNLPPTEDTAVDVSEVRQSVSSGMSRSAQSKDLGVSFMSEEEQLALAIQLSMSTDQGLPGGTGQHCDSVVHTVKMEQGSKDSLPNPALPVPDLHLSTTSQKELDVSSMSEEEQLALAMQLSLSTDQDVPGGVGQHCDSVVHTAEIEQGSKDSLPIPALPVPDHQFSATSRKDQDVSYLSEKEQLALAMQMSIDTEKGQKLLDAVKCGKLKDICNCLESGAPVDYRDKNGATPLFLACFYGHRDAVLVLLKHRADVNARHKLGYTPLTAASQKGHTAIVQLLIAQSADVHAKAEGGVTAFYLAAQNGHTEAADILLQHSSDPNIRDIYGNTPLLAASQGGHTATVQLLLAHSANVHARSKVWFRFFIKAATRSMRRAGDETTAGTGTDKEEVLLDNEGLTALSQAAQNGHTAIVEMFLQQSSDPNIQDEDGCTPLMAASLHGHTATVELLLAHSADVHTKSKDGSTALRNAVQNGHTATAEILLQHSIDPNVRDVEGCTPLIIASQNGHMATTELLLAHSADVHAQSKIGRTALLQAAQQGHAAIVQLLLRHAADPNSQDKTGKTAVFLSVFTGHTAVTQLLLASGANPNISAVASAMNVHFSWAVARQGLTPLIAAVQGPTEEQQLYGVTRNALDEAACILLNYPQTDVNIQEPSTGWTALSMACKAGNLKLVRMLLQHQADASIKDRDGLTAGNVAFAHDQITVWEELQPYYTTAIVAPQDYPQTPTTTETSMTSELITTSHTSSEGGDTEPNTEKATTPETGGQVAPNPKQKSTVGILQDKSKRELARRTGQIINNLFKPVGDKVLPSRRAKAKGIYLDSRSKALRQQAY